VGFDCSSFYAEFEDYSATFSELTKNFMKEIDDPFEDDQKKSSNSIDSNAVFSREEENKRRSE
jgi:hypothetical protein